MFGRLCLAQADLRQSHKNPPPPSLKWALSHLRLILAMAMPMGMLASSCRATPCSTKRCGCLLTSATKAGGGGRSRSVRSRFLLAAPPAPAAAPAALPAVAFAADGAYGFEQLSSPWVGVAVAVAGAAGAWGAEDMALWWLATANALDGCCCMPPLLGPKQHEDR
jgi:hypothetical protein